MIAAFLADDILYVWWIYYHSEDLRSTSFQVTHCGNTFHGALEKHVRTVRYPGEDFLQLKSYFDHRRLCKRVQSGGRGAQLKLNQSINLYCWKLSKLTSSKLENENRRNKFGGTGYNSWLRRYATNRKGAGSNSDKVIAFFNLPNPCGRTMALGLIEPLTEMSTRNLPGE
jgi:hypothetical protein